MEFILSQTDGEPDVPGMYRKTFTWTDTRNVGSPDDLPSYGKENWPTVGRNHRVENGHIARDLDREEDVIEIATLEGLVQFVRDNGAVVVEPSYFNPDVMQIEIYNGYRE